MKYGLTEKQVQEIIAIISSYQEVDQAIIFGSRAINTFKEASDVDIALIGEKCDLLLSAKIKDHLEDETYLPFFFDIIAYNTIQSPELKKHIQTKGKVIFQRKEEWKEVKLGEIINLYYGKSLVANKRIIGDIPVYSSAGITGYHNEPLVNSRGIIVGRKGTIGTVYKSESPFYCIDTVYYILANDEKFNFNFMYYLLQTLGLNDLNSDSAVPGLNRNTVYDQSFMLPPLPEQKAIAEVLSSLDDKIDLLQRQNKTLEEMAETLFRQWFIEERDESWEFAEIKKYVTVIDNRGKTPPNQPERTTFPLIEVNALGKETRLIDYSVIRKYVTEETYKSWFRKYLSKYDILLSTVGSIGALSMYLSEVGNVAQNVVGIRAQGISSLYLYQTLKFKTNEIMQLDIGGVQPSIKIPHLLSMIIPVPCQEIQVKFDNQVLNYVTRMEINSAQIIKLENLRDTLLPKLMSGEVSIKKCNNRSLTWKDIKI